MVASHSKCKAPRSLYMRRVWRLSVCDSDTWFGTCFTAAAQACIDTRKPLVLTFLRDLANLGIGLCSESAICSTQERAEATGASVRYERI